MKQGLFLLITIFISCGESKQEKGIEDDYNLAEREFLDHLIESEFIVTNTSNTVILYDSLLSFESIGGFL